VQSNRGAYIRSSPQQALSHIEDPVLVQPEDMALTRPLHQVLQVLPQELMQLFEYRFGFLQMRASRWLFFARTRLQAKV